MIYFAEAIGVGHIKIGFTDGEPAARVAMLQTGSPVPLRLLGTIPGTMEDEKNLHRRFASALVCGEWFKPVAELVALIPSATPLICGKVEVVEQSVSIRVLTVGRKQFTKNLLDQLPIDIPFEWEHIFDDMYRNYPCERLLVLPENVQVWGWIKGGTFPVECDYQTFIQAEFSWLIFASDGVLYKSRDFLTCRHYFPQNRSAKLTNDEHREAVSKMTKLYNSRRAIPGWSDQLYIGV